MKATDKIQHPSVPLLPPQAQPAAEVKPSPAQLVAAPRLDDMDRTELARPRAADAGLLAGVGTSQGESSEVALRIGREIGRGGSRGVRTKKLKTEQVGSMPRVARAAFQGVNDIVAQGRQILASKSAPKAETTPVAD